MFGNRENPKPQTKQSPKVYSQHKFYVPDNFESSQTLQEINALPEVVNSPDKGVLTDDDNPVDIFLDYARTETIETKDSHPYFTLLSGDSHVLNFCSPKEVNFAIQTLIQDANVAWNIKASMFHELMDTASISVGKEVVKTLSNLVIDSANYYAQAQALEALTYIIANDGNFF